MASRARADIQPTQKPRQYEEAMVLNLFVPLMLALTLCAAPAFAVEQCRFIQAKPEREACYQRQEAELAAKRKPEPTRDSKTMQALEQMKHEDEALNRQLHSICRGC
jgi:hypothetical protein